MGIKTTELDELHIMAEGRHTAYLAIIIINYYLQQRFQEVEIEHGTQFQSHLMQMSLS